MCITIITNGVVAGTNFSLPREHARDGRTETQTRRGYLQVHGAGKSRGGTRGRLAARDIVRLRWQSVQDFKRVEDGHDNGALHLRLRLFDMSWAFV
jgi:hypothetical protein